MIISEKQIMQLIRVANKLQSLLLCDAADEEAKKAYNGIQNLLNTIANQQSEELKVIE